MSKSCGLVKGKFEIPIPEKMESKYSDNEIMATAFYGGVNRGRCIQLTITQESYIQLDEAGVDQLIKILKYWKKEYN